MKRNMRITVGLVITLVLLTSVMVLSPAVRAQIPWTVFDRLQADEIRVLNGGQTIDAGGLTITAGGITASGDSTFADDLDVTTDFDVDGDTTLDDLTMGGTITQDINTFENVGNLPSIASANITFTSQVTDTSPFIVSDGEVWIVHDVLVNITANYDCTGSDCVMTIGDANDPNGFIDLVDAEMQAADTEGTGFAAGWQGMATGTRGVYLNEGTTNGAHRFVYAPDGADETIDVLIGGTDPAAGAATVYIIYTRIQ